MPQHTNRLIHETSPYLLQHAHNPVDWYPWGEEAFQRARREDKPVLVSIGYAACHWCHVMERESFENPEVAAFMNQHFINIKVDREERPDVDHIYMDAVQAMSGTGGWPLNVFLTPDGKPFYGGTYYPPRRAFNRASWSEVLQALSVAYRERREEVVGQAETLTEHLRASNSFGQGSPAAFTPGRQKLDDAFRNIMKNADRQWGGFGRAPKFPQTFTIAFLIRYAHLAGSQEALSQALLSLDSMIQGGIYDHIGGGFARYATDTEWLVPHFEKMLYDNALLVATLAEAYQLTHNPVYRGVIDETLHFVERELMHPDGGFYSALDADSEGEEGKFYVWTAGEVAGVLGEDAALFSAYYDITPGGNWEGKSIPRVKKPLAAFAAESGIGEEELRALLERGKAALLRQRNQRVRPGLDDKVLLGWNALMNTAYCKAYAATGEEHYRQLAVRNMEFLMAAFRAGDHTFHHTWKNGAAKHHAFLDDYACLIAALMELSAITGNHQWLLEARGLCQTVLDHFKDPASAFFFFTPDFQSDILLRKKEVYDGATPSGNAVMATNLYQLSILFDKPDWRTLSEELLFSLGEVLVKYPTSFGVWLCLLQEFLAGTNEIAVVGAEASVLAKDIFRLFIPHKVLMASAAPNDDFPLLAQKKVNGETLIFLCKNYVCGEPVNTIAAFKTLVNSNNFRSEQ